MLDTLGFILDMVVLALVVVGVCVEVRLGWVWGTGQDGRCTGIGMGFKKLSARGYCYMYLTVLDYSGTG